MSIAKVLIVKTNTKAEDSIWGVGVFEWVNEFWPMCIVALINMAKANSNTAATEADEYDAKVCTFNPLSLSWHFIITKCL